MFRKQELPATLAGSLKARRSLLEALAGEGDDDLAELEFHEGDGDFGGGEAGCADEFIDR